MSVTLGPLSQDAFDRVAHLTVLPDQIRFSGTVAEAFASAEDGVDFHAVSHQNRAVGFFKIDRAYHARYPFAGPNDLGLRAFLIDAAEQGKGYATAAIRALPTYLNRHYPDASAVVLTVNMINPAAIRCYLSGGFQDTGDVWPHGEAGAQHVMRLSL